MANLYTVPTPSTWAHVVRAVAYAFIGLSAAERDLLAEILAVPATVTIARGSEQERAASVLYSMGLVEPLPTAANPYHLEASWRARCMYQTGCLWIARGTTRLGISREDARQPFFAKLAAQDRREHHNWIRNARRAAVRA